MSELENKNFNLPINNKKPSTITEKQYIKDLEDLLIQIDPNKLTPLEALQTIYDLKEKINNLEN